MEDKTILFIQKANIVHNKKYDYSKSNYVTAFVKVCIICPIHGEFLQRPSNHLTGQGCKKCGIESRHQNKPKSIELFIEQCNLIHFGIYDYSKVKYIDNSTKVEIICLQHGSFWMRPYSHLSGQRCPTCSRNHNKSIDNYLFNTKKCKGCHIEKPIDDFYIANNYYRGKCKECECNIKVEYRKNPKNKELLRTYHKMYRNTRRKNDPVFRLRMDIPTIIRRSIKKNYNGDSIWKYLPYSPQQLKEYLESKFENEMNWDNHGIYWHIDHIIPQALFKYDDTNHPDFIKCWSLDNLRPLKAIDNMKKSSIYNGKRIFKKSL